MNINFLKSKKLLWFLLLSPFVLIGIIILAVTNPTKARPSNSIPSVSPARLKQDATSLIETGQWRNYKNPEILDKAASFIRKSWERSGLEVEEQTYEVNGVVYRNLFTGFGPINAPKVIVGAHYDVYGEQPGADDNASCIAALLALGRMFSEAKPMLTKRLELVAFTLEEPPFFRTEQMGSAVYAKKLQDDQAQISAMIALDMIGYFDDEPGSQSYPTAALGAIYPNKANFIAVVGNMDGLGLVRQIKSVMKGAADIPVISINAPASIPGIDFSDHLNFWKYDVPAVLITDTSFYRNANYHQTTDTLDTLDFERTAEVVKGIYAAARDLAK